MAQATRAHRLVLFTTQEPSLALGVDRQVELLHLDLARARRAAQGGELPPETNRALEVACRAVEGGVRRAAPRLRVQTTSCCWTLWDSTSRGSPSPRDLPQTKRTRTAVEAAVPVLILLARRAFGVINSLHEIAERSGPA